MKEKICLCKCGLSRVIIKSNQILLSIDCVQCMERVRCWITGFNTDSLGEDLAKICLLACTRAWLGGQKVS